MYLTIAYAILTAVTMFLAFHTKKSKRVANIIMSVITGAFALQRVIAGDHSVAYPLTALKEIYAPLMTLGQNQLLVIVIGSAAITAIAYFQMKIIRDRC